MDILRKFIFESRILAKGFDKLLPDIPDLRTRKAFDSLESPADPFIGIRIADENVIEDQASVIHR